MRMVNCLKLGEELEGLDNPPFNNELGQKIYNNISKQAWKMWLGQQTMIINENRLDMSNPAHRAYLTQQAEFFLFAETEHNA